MGINHSDSYRINIIWSCVYLDMALVLFWGTLVIRHKSLMPTGIVR